MLGTIHRYEQGQIKLDTLLNNLEALSQCVEDAPEDWLAALQAEMGTLNQTYAAACIHDEGSRKAGGKQMLELTSEEYENVCEALTKIKDLISAQTDRAD